MWNNISNISTKRFPCQLHSENSNEALPYLRRAIDKDPQQWNTWYMAGQCYRFLDDIDNAIKYLTHASELKRDEASIYLALGNV